MARQPIFIEGAVMIAGEGVRRFRTIDELLVHLYAPLGTATGVLEVRLAGIGPDGAPFNVSLAFESLEYGTPPGGAPKAARPPATLGAEGPVPAAPAPAAPNEPAPTAASAASTPLVVGPGAYPRRKHLGELLVEAGLVTEAQVEAALAEQRDGGGRERIGAILVRKGWITPKLLYRILAEQQKA